MCCREDGLVLHMYFIFGKNKWKLIQSGEIWHQMRRVYKNLGRKSDLEVQKCFTWQLQIFSLVNNIIMI